MQARVIGFDLARAYAIFGMYIVNFNFSFGSLMTPQDGVGRFMNLFTGNSTAIFILCAGIGVTQMLQSSGQSEEELKALKSKILRRSWFLFALGLLLYNWWSGDILHFYGGYMHVAAFLIFLPRKYFLMIAACVLVIYHLLLAVIPVDTGWDFTIFNYTDFWTPIGFLRNTFFNGWNSMFPWLTYFLAGMWIGGINWQDKSNLRRLFFFGMILFLTVQGLRYYMQQQGHDSYWFDYVMAEYFPPYLPFMAVTMGFACMVIPICMMMGDSYRENPIVRALQKTGRMTLSLYVFHLTVGMLLFGFLFNKNYTGYLEDEEPSSSVIILLFSVVFYLLSVVLSQLWSRRFSHGPLEMLMRKISG